MPTSGKSKFLLRAVASGNFKMELHVGISMKGARNNGSRGYNTTSDSMLHVYSGSLILATALSSKKAGRTLSPPAQQLEDKITDWVLCSHDKCLTQSNQFLSQAMK